MTWQRGEMCGGCAGRRGTEANATARTMRTLGECIDSGEPFYCHESMRAPDATSAPFSLYRSPLLPQSRWRLCRAWMNARAAIESKSENGGGNG